MSHFYGTEYKIWAGFELVGSTENFELGAIPNPPKSDDWKWSTDEDASNDFLRNPYFRVKSLTLEGTPLAAQFLKGLTKLAIS